MGSILDKLKTLDTNRINTEEAVELAALGSLVQREFEARKVPVPAAITDGLKSLTRDIETRRQDAIEQRLREIAAEDATDKTASERRADRAAEKAALEAQIGVTSRA